MNKKSIINNTAGTKPAASTTPQPDPSKVQAEPRRSFLERLRVTTLEMDDTPELSCPVRQPHEATQPHARVIPRLSSNARLVLEKLAKGDTAGFLDPDDWDEALCTAAGEALELADVTAHGKTRTATSADCTVPFPSDSPKEPDAPLVHDRPRIVSAAVAIYMETACGPGSFAVHTRTADAFVTTTVRLDICTASSLRETAYQGAQSLLDQHLSLGRSAYDAVDRWPVCFRHALTQAVEKPQVQQEQFWVSGLRINGTPDFEDAEWITDSQMEDTARFAEFAVKG